ncbi:TonB-dependent receptor [Granulicella mallensis]|uniref:Outer membrane receptor protein involved in Fe transport n=1 Tax=Granulicella mallensis TaxID=940614 RepID=A0A7W7ZTK6_9BACT|nr:TonB-dependent receptor [Granulicella mallensis]MBB5065919.1 outer membrane receptor protein involved in Fe transport [Granulicella mallensis]
MRLSKRFLRVFLVPATSLVLTLLLTPFLSAQIDRAGLNGTVKDADGRSIAGAKITALQIATGQQRDTVSSATGTYDIPELPLGLYRVTYDASGFHEKIIDGIQQTVGHTRTLNVVMSVEGMTQQVEVSDVGTQLDETSAALGARIAPEQVKNLPLNGRNWSTLTALVPGAVDTGGSNQRSIRFAGRGLDDNNFTYDGIDATNVVNQAQQPFVRLAIPTEAIQEFRIDTMLFTAENGSTPGGQIAVASKTGTNNLHGSLFEFLRNDIFDARQPIDTLNPNKPAFRLNQYGGSLGGPILHDKTFFYFAYEGLRQTLGQTLPGLVPSDSFRAMVAQQSPALIPILNAFPEGQFPSGTSTNVSESIGSGRQLDHEDSVVLRLDHHFSTADSVYLRFNFDASYSDVPLIEGQTYLNDRQLVTSRPVNGELESLHLFSPRLVNELKFGFNRGNVYTTDQSVLQTPYAISISGFTTLSGNEYKPGVGNTYSYIDNLTWIKGAHTLKFGVEVRRIQLNQGNTANGTITFSSAANFLNNLVSSATYAAELPVNGLRKTETYSYVEDEWKVRDNLTLNAGVRYTFYNIFHEVLGRANPFDFATCGPQGYCGVGASFGQPNTLDVDPRLSVTWAPDAGGGRTVLRSGFGLYHGDGQLDDQNFPISNEIAQYSLNSIANLSYPITPFLSDTPGIIAPREADRDRKDMYVAQWGLSVQQALPHELVGTLSYVGSKGTYLLNTSYINLKDPATGLRPYPAFGQVQSRGNENNSSYQGFVASLQRTFTNGLLLSANYTYSHEIDQDSAGGGDSDFPQNPACPSCERASGDFDVRHVFNSNAVYDLPFGPGKAFLSNSGIASEVFGRWSATAIVTVRTGLPVNVTEDRSSSSVATGYTTSQRPNRVSGVSLTPPGGHKISQWINPAAFSLVTGSGYGDSPRNVARGPDLWQADFGLAKRIPLTEKMQLQFRTEFFNIFNRAQYGLPLADLSSPTTFGQIVGAVNTGPVGTGTPRQIQFMLRLEF